MATAVEASNVAVRYVAEAERGPFPLPTKILPVVTMGCFLGT